MSFILEDPETERLVMNEAYNLHYHDPMLTILILVMIPIRAGCLIIAFMLLRKPTKKRTV